MMATTTAFSFFSMADGRPPLGSARLLARNFGAFLSRFGKTNGDRLLSAFDSPSFSAFTGLESAALPATHRAPHRFACRFSVASHSSSF
jgi:hypothetical protein